MPITSLTIVPPKILQYFDACLLMEFLEMQKFILENEIEPLAKKKIRKQDVGKQRKFNLLLLKYQEMYERKTIEKADYKAACKEKSKKVSHFPSSGGTMQFRRMVPNRSIDGDDIGDILK